MTFTQLDYMNNMVGISEETGTLREYLGSPPVLLLVGSVLVLLLVFCVVYLLFCLSSSLSCAQCCLCLDCSIFIVASVCLFSSSTPRLRTGVELATFEVIGPCTDFTGKI